MHKILLYGYRMKRRMTLMNKKRILTGDRPTGRLHIGI